jgi:tryptophan synthase beta chain
MAPLVSQLVASKLVEPVAFMQTECFDAGVLFARTEGILPAPESMHAIRATLVEAERCRKEGKAETILFNLSGHGHLDLAAYDAYFAGDLGDHALAQSDLDSAMAEISGLPRIA